VVNKSSVIVSGKVQQYRQVPDHNIKQVTSSATWYKETVKVNIFKLFTTIITIIIN